MSNYSPVLPLQLDPTNGFQNNQTIIAVVMQNLKMLVLTSPGERVMDPNFGVGMRRFLFEQNNIEAHSRISVRIRRQVLEYMPFVEIVDIKFGTEQDNENIRANSLQVSIEFFISATSESGALNINI